jgi:predicted  nucleic acid-binding Zn-ribbon protein
MGKLSNIFGVIALVLAGGAAYLSFTIAARRAEFRLRADTTLVDIVKAVDADSGTTTASSVSFTPGDPKAKTAETGTLSWKSFHDAKDDSGAYQAFQNTLGLALDQVKKLVLQRNTLAATIVEAATTLSLPADQLDVASLRNLADDEAFAKATSTMQSHAAAVAARDKAMVKALQDAAEGMEETLDVTSLTSREQTRNDDDQVVLGDYRCQDTLNGFVGEVKDLNTRSNSYAKTLADAIDTIKPHQGVFRWSASKRSVQSKTDYEGALTQMLNDFGTINEQLDGFVAAKKEVALQKDKIDKLETDLDQMRSDLTETQLAKAKAETENRRLKILIGETPGFKGKGPDLGENWTQNVEGKILSVNTDYNYVILDLGADVVKEGTEMLVARKDELIAKVQVARVLSKISVADILPIASNGTVKTDDRVIMPAVQQ